MSRRVGIVALAFGVFFFILVSFPVEAACADCDSNSAVGLQALRHERRYRETGKRDQENVQKNVMA
jgi:hypothetical protein